MMLKKLKAERKILQKIYENPRRQFPGVTKHTPKRKLHE